MPQDPYRPPARPIADPGLTEHALTPPETFRADLPRPKPTKPDKPRKPPKVRLSIFELRPRHGWRFWVAAIAGGLFLATLSGLVSVYAYVNQHYLQDVPATPPKEQLDLINRTPAILFFDKSGALIASRGPKYGDRVRLTQLPPYVPHAFLAAEDKRFYRHGALDLWGIGRALVVNYQAGRIVQGGSTLTQQLAKGLFLGPDQTLKRKIQEAVVARRLARMLTKDEILELYLNRTYFGANTFGIDAASRTYFGKPASKLTLAESALLAALPKAPTRMALTHNMAGALVRQKLILDSMLAEGWITPQDRADALANPPKLSDRGSIVDGVMGYALDYATNEVLSLTPANSPDLMVRLTIDTSLQQAGATALRQVVRGDGFKAGADQGALLALSPLGAIRVMVGGVDYNESVFNRAVQARRQPGSSFKPIVYAAALEKGVMPNETIIDGPIRFGGWSPRNYGGGYRGAVTVETALAQSINTVAVKLAQRVGGPAVSQLAARFGFSGIPANPELSIALGAYETPLIEMVSAYQVFQNKGQSMRPYIVDEIQTISGERLYLHQTSSPLPVYSIVHTSMMVRMLQRVVTRGTGTRAAFGRPAAGKTGTSQNWRDAWFIGFTPDYVAGVWVGNDDNSAMSKVTGGGVSAEIWRRFMITAHADLPVRNFDWLLAGTATPVAEPTPVVEEEEAPPARPDPAPKVRKSNRRGAFYDDLSKDFGSTQGERSMSDDTEYGEPFIIERPIDDRSAPTPY